MTSPSNSFGSALIWIVEDNDDYREQLADLLSLDASIKCPNTFASYEEAREQMESDDTLPDIMLMDLNLPGIHGIEAIREMKQSHPAVQTVVLTVAGNRKTVFEALRAGAAGYLLKSEPFEGILQHIHEVIEGGGIPLSSSVTPYILDVLKMAPATEKDSDLTDHEIQILEKLANGQSRKEIASEFNVATVTIDYHLRNIYGKLGVHSTSGAVGQAFRKGILK
ncbi:response regulator [Pontiella sulfatireligans]|uniref:Transcriptional regulatory protein DegU n=1 Tax=Pontiella sulfatireligans TaxID=2750658 RepID=A0A6C2UFC9_9BACT|nr:response regulator transcription factor [Pontiella sulfatireligans]VGO18583.1 Transcriptional regulatory protein DegU [Pontiella sulfatireligans]